MRRFGSQRKIRELQEQADSIRSTLSSSPSRGTDVKPESTSSDFQEANPSTTDRSLHRSTSSSRSKVALSAHSKLENTLSDFQELNPSTSQQDQGPLLGKLEKDRSSLKPLEDLQQDQYVSALTNVEVQLVQEQSQVERLRRNLELEGRTIVRLSQEESQVKQLRGELELEGRTVVQVQDSFRLSQEESQVKQLRGELELEGRTVVQVQEQMAALESSRDVGVSQLLDQVALVQQHLQHTQYTQLSSQAQLAEEQSQVEKLRNELGLEGSTLAQVHKEMATQNSSHEVRMSQLVDQVAEVQQLQEQFRHLSSPEFFEGQLAQEPSQLGKLRHELELERRAVASLHEQMAAQHSSHEFHMSQLLDQIGNRRHELEKDNRRATEQLQDLQQKQRTQTSSAEVLEAQLAQEESQVAELQQELKLEGRITVHFRERVSAQEFSEEVQKSHHLDQVGKLQGELEAERRATLQIQNLQQAVSAAAQLALEADQLDRLRQLVIFEKRGLVHLPEPKASQASPKELRMSELIKQQDQVGKLQSELEIERRELFRAIQQKKDLQHKEPRQLPLAEVLESQLAGQTYIEKLCSRLKQERKTNAELHEQMCAQAASQKLLREDLTSQLLEEREQIVKLRSESEVESRATQQMRNEHQGQSKMFFLSHEALEAQLAHGGSEMERLRHQLQAEREIVAELHEQRGLEASSLKLLTSELCEERDQVEKQYGQMGEQVTSEMLLASQLKEAQDQVEVLGQQLAIERRAVAKLSEQTGAQASSQMLLTVEFVEEQDQVGKLRSELEAQCEATEQTVCQTEGWKQKQPKQLSSKLAPGQSQVDKLRHHLALERGALAELHEQIVIAGAQAPSQQLLKSQLVKISLESQRELEV